MDKKKGRDLESQLEWYYVSTQTLVRIVVGFLVIAGLVAAGVFFFVKKDDSARRASQEIADAADVLARAKKQQDAPLLQREIAAADEKLADARRDLAAGQNERATKTALDVKSTALKILAGAVIKSEASVADVAGTVQIQRASRTTWETLRQSMPLYEGDFIKTGPNGIAEVLWIDGTMYRIRPETLFEVHAATPGGSNPQARRRHDRRLDRREEPLEGRRRTSRRRVIDVELLRRAAAGRERDVRLRPTAASTVSRTRRARASRSASASAPWPRRGGPIGPKTSLPEPPSLLAPDDNLLVDLRKTEPLRLRWSPIKEASAYRVQIAASRLFVKDSVLRLPVRAPAARDAHPGARPGPLLLARAHRREGLPGPLLGVDGRAPVQGHRRRPGRRAGRGPPARPRDHPAPAGHRNAPSSSWDGRSPEHLSP